MIATTWAGEHSWEAQGVRRDRSSPLVVLPGRVSWAEFDRMRMYAATIAARRVEDRLAVWDLGVVPPTIADLGLPSGPGAAVALLRHLGVLHRHDPTVFDDVLVRAGVEQAVLSALFAASPAVAERGAADRGRPRALLADAFIREQAGDPITVADIAAAARLSVRGVQDLFQRETGRSPMVHLREVRLDRARQDLVAGDPSSGATVEAIARRWGFAHLGRFAGSYHAAYSEYPRETLAR